MAKRSGKTRKPKQSSPVIDLARFIKRFVILTDEQALIVALWIVHTHCAEQFEQTPYLSVSSAEKRCGKTRLIESVSLLVARPWGSVLPSEAVLYRKIAKDFPTLLLDEVDTIFNPKSADRYEAHRAILNAGHRRNAKVARCIGNSNEVEDFDAFCPKLLAGIGGLPETVADRSIPIRLERKMKSETVERFLRRDVEPEATKLRERVEEWVGAHPDLGDARPDMPDSLNDRMLEGCEPLVAIADAMRCGKATRAALVEILSHDRLDDHETVRLRLLRDVRTVWLRQEKNNKGLLKGIPTRTLIDRLCDISEASWSNYYGRGPIDPNDFASLLRPFGIGAGPIRYGKGKGEVARGYKRDAFQDAWERYLD